MSDATPIAREWLHERSLSLERTEDLAAMLEAYATEQTAAEAARHADCCVDREELAALRAGMRDALDSYDKGFWYLCRHKIAALLAAPEAAP